MKYRRPPEVTIHDSLGQWVWSRMGASRGYTAAKHSSRSPGQAHRTSISHSGNSLKLTTTRETSYTSPQETEPAGRITGFQGEVVQSIMSSIPHHCGDTLCPNSATHWDTKHLLAWQLWLLSSRASGENQTLGNAWPYPEVLLLNATTILREAKAITIFAVCMVSLVCSGPYCSSIRAPGPAGPGEVTLLRPLRRDALMQSLLCTAWVEIQNLASLRGGNQGHSVVLRQHYRYNTWVRHLWQPWGQWGEHKAASKTSSGVAHMHVWLGMVML